MRWVEKLNKLGAGELLISSVDMEGTKKGFDKELYNKISEATDLPIIVNGGFGRLEDLTFFRSNKKLDSLALSSTIHYDLFTIKDIKNFSRKIGEVLERIILGLFPRNSKYTKCKKKY